jgi:hypothetical protein
MDTKVLEKLFESIGVSEKLQSPEVKSQVESLIEELVTARAKAFTEDADMKEKTLLEAAEELKDQFNEKEKVLTTEAQKFAEELAKEMVAKEAIMLEELDKYKAEVEQTIKEEAADYRKSLEGIVEEEAKAYKESIEKIVLEEADNYKKMLETVAIEEANNFAKNQEQTLHEEVGVFKEDLINKVSAFMESELKGSIPETIMESAQELAAMKPLVEGIVSTFGKNYVKLDDASYKLIKEARTENEKLSESVNKKTQDIVNMTARLQSLEKKSKLFELTEGMTVAQRKRAEKILESYKADEIQEKFEAVKDIILAESATPKVVSKDSSTVAPKQTTVLSESAQKKVEKLKSELIVEGKTVNVNPEISQWSNTLNRQIRMSRD